MGSKPDKAGNTSALAGRNGFGLANLFLLAALLVAPTLAVIRWGILDHPFWLSATAAAVLAAFVCLWFDKRRAEQERWRVPENFLHMLEVLGGWPGSFVAQRLFRHKISKVGYQVVFWLIVVAYELVSVDFLLGWKIAQQMRRLAGL